MAIIMNLKNNIDILCKKVRTSTYRHQCGEYAKKWGGACPPAPPHPTGRAIDNNIGFSIGIKVQQASKQAKYMHNNNNKAIFVIHLGSISFYAFSWTNGDVSGGRLDQVGVPKK